MNLTIIREYASDDPEYMGDPCCVRLVDEDGSRLLSGDWYHDKIDDQIRGFMKALAFLEQKVEVVTRRVTSEDY